MKWTAKKKQILKEEYGLVDTSELAGKLKCSVEDIHSKAVELRNSGEDVRKWVSRRMPHWDPAEDAYLVHANHYLTMDELSDELNKPVPYIRDRLRELGINKSRPKEPTKFKRCDNPACNMVYESKRRTCSNECAQFLQHIKIPSAKTLQDEYGRGMSIFNIALKHKISVPTLLRLLENYGIDRKGFAPVSPGQRKGAKGGATYSVGGLREDIGTYVRSRWEANFLRYLNYKKLKWEYEPKTFVFEGIKRGTRTYTPDVYIPKEDVWIEIKGYLRAKDKTKIRRMKRYHPEAFKKLQAVTKNENVAATKFFVDEMKIPIYAYYDDLTKKYSNKIEHWEKKS